MDKRAELTSEQKIFVDNNRQLTPREISERLKVPIEAVNRYKSHISWDHMVFYLDLFMRHFISKLEKHKKKIVIGSFAFIMLFAWDARHYTYFLPHLRGDQLHYTALAMKLETKGLNGYTLRGVDMLVSKESGYEIGLFPAEGKGSLLEGLADANIFYYDQPFHHMPFGFPMALMISHNLFARGQPYIALQVPEEQAMIANVPSGLKSFRFPPKVGGKQFYAVIVPLFFSLVLVAAVFFLGMEIFNNAFIALLAMFLMAISPTDILSSQKVWADDMTAAFAALGALLYLRSLKKDSVLLALSGGLLCGISIITKQLGVFVPVTIFVWHFVSNIGKLLKKETFLGVVFDKKLWAFSAGTAILSAFWFLKVYSYYGDPFYRPGTGQKDLLEVAKDPFFKMVSGRPRSVFFVSIPYQTPLFFLAYLTPIIVWLKPENWKKCSLLFTWMAVMVILSQLLYIHGEERYWLTNFPAIALLSGFAAWSIKEFLDTTYKMLPGTWLLIASLLLCAAWSVPMGLEAVFRNEALIMKPF